MKITVEEKKKKNSEYKKQEYQNNKEYYRLKGKEYRENNPGSAARNAKRWRLSNPEKYRILTRENNLKKIGCTTELYDRLYIEQEGKCKICNIEKDKLCVDHCHTTGKIRGLLCDNCNHGLGKFKDNTDFLNKAINYLNE